MEKLTVEQVEVPRVFTGAQVNVSFSMRGTRVWNLDYHDYPRPG